METATEPRRRNLAETRTRILAAAADCFAGSGYARAGLREIADLADVAPSLVSKHFGTKAALFEQALLEVIRANSVFTRDKPRFGETMARLMADRGNTDITVMLVLGLADAESHAIVQRVVREHILDPLAEWLGPPHALDRATNLFALITGFAIQMRGLHAGPVPPASLAWMAGALQAIVDEGVDESASADNHAAGG